jgi:WD40 repeat protein
LTGHEKNVYAVCYSRDGRRLASAGQDHTVRLWDPASHKEIAVFRGHAQPVKSVAFSPDGRRLVSGGEDRTVRVWETADPDRSQVLRGHSKPVHAVAWSLDGQLLASASEDRTIRLWEAASGQEAFTLLGHDVGVHGLAFSPDGKRVASAANVVKVWDAKTADELSTLRGHTKSVLGVAFSPNGEHLATAGEDGTIKLWESDSRPEAGGLAGQTEEAVQLQFSPGGRLLAVANRRGGIGVWDMARGRLVHSFAGKHKEGEAASLAFTPDGGRLASACVGNVTVWDLATEKELFTRERSGTHAVFSPDGQTLAMAGYSRDTEGHPMLRITFADAGTGEGERSTQPVHGQTTRLVYSPDGRRVAAGAVLDMGYCLLRVWNAETGLLEAEFPMRTQHILGLAFSPDNQRLYADSGGFATPAEVKCYDLTSQREVLSFRGHEETIFGLALSADGKRLVTVSADKSVRIWDAATGAELFSLRGPAAWTCVAMSSDNRYLAASANGKMVSLWDAGGRESK